MAPHTWSYLGDTVSDATHLMYYRGQKIKEAYYRGEKIWGKTEDTFRIEIYSSSGSYNFKSANKTRVSKNSHISSNQRWESFTFTNRNGLCVNFSGSPLIYTVYNSRTQTTSEPQTIEEDTYIDEATGDTVTSAITHVELAPNGNIVTFYNMGNLTHIDFAMSNALRSVLDPFPKMPNNHSFANCFSYCDKLSSVPSNLFSKNPQITNFENVFKYNLALSVSETFSTLFEKQTEATNFKSAFMGVTFNNGVPNDIFKFNTKAVTFEQCFAECVFGNYGIQSNLFRYCTLAQDFSETFAVSDISSIPSDLFRYCANAERFIGTFAWTLITSIPQSLFRYNVRAKDFASCFLRCDNLTSIPASLFRYCAQAEAFNACFASDARITSIPSRLFYYNTNAYDFDYTFYACESVASIGTQLMPNTSSHFDDGKITLAYCFAYVGKTFPLVPNDVFVWCCRINKLSAKPITSKPIYSTFGGYGQTEQWYCQIRYPPVTNKEAYIAEHPRSYMTAHAQFDERLTDYGVTISFVYEYGGMSLKERYADSIYFPQNSSGSGKILLTRYKYSQGFSVYPNGVYSEMQNFTGNGTKFITPMVKDGSFRYTFAINTEAVAGEWETSNGWHYNQYSDNDYFIGLNRNLTPIVVPYSFFYSSRYKNTCPNILEDTSSYADMSEYRILENPKIKAKPTNEPGKYERVFKADYSYFLPTYIGPYAQGLLMPVIEKNGPYEIPVKSSCPFPWTDAPEGSDELDGFRPGDSYSLEDIIRSTSFLMESMVGGCFSGILDKKILNYWGAILIQDGVPRYDARAIIVPDEDLAHRPFIPCDPILEDYHLRDFGAPIFFFSSETSGYLPESFIDVLITEDEDEDEDEDE